MNNFSQLANNYLEKKAHALGLGHEKQANQADIAAAAKADAMKMLGNPVNLQHIKSTADMGTMKRVLDAAAPAGQPVDYGKSVHKALNETFPASVKKHGLVPQAPQMAQKLGLMGLIKKHPVLAALVGGGTAGTAAYGAGAFDAAPEPEGLSLAAKLGLLGGAGLAGYGAYNMLGSDEEEDEE